MSEVADEVLASVRHAADALQAAADRVPDCDCAHLDPGRMAAVVSDLMRAKLAAATVHRSLKGLEHRHGGRAEGLATLETQPLDGLPTEPVVPLKQAEQSIAKLADMAGSEMTGGQCC
ncbi:TYRO tyrosine kinase-binding precursor [Micractinium conductrix]|uniref:TYRO tyrosine kinase-binding n=1 Tax=Micractinium conductrix TaxID=554055 RepID=A0A2P6VAN1_9CHLO|nr:TYRO tyrosine kinase-binding precursor [Micractinium conductrix]|eukprot:PSC71159.1 TYRO tyrosine kinase-binding precursor [Micractinium conductrix]